MDFIAFTKALNKLTGEGKIFLYGSSSLSNYYNKKINLIRVLTDLNIAKLGVVFPDIKFSKDLSIDCYLELDEGIIATFLTKENIEDDELLYLKTILLEENENPLMFFIYSIKKNKYYLFNDLYFKNIKRNTFLLESTEGLNCIDFLDIALLAGELEFQIEHNKKSIIIDNDEFNENNSIKTYLPFLEIILTSKKPYNSLCFLSDIGLLKIFFPFLNDLIGVEQDRSLHPEGDVYNHTLHCFQFVKKPTLILAFGILLHDYGKTLPSLKDFSEHSTLGANKVEEILKPYGYEENFINDVIFLVQYHMINSYFYRINDREKIRIFNNKLGTDLLKLFKADTLGSVGKLDVYLDVISKLKKLNKNSLNNYISFKKLINESFNYS